MRLPGSLSPALALLVLAAGGRPALAQSPAGDRAPFVASLAGPDPAPGLGVTLPVRITSARGEPAPEVRVSAARLTSPFGATLPVQAPPEGPGSAGVRPFRADLPSPGAWTLEFTLTAAGRPPVRASVGFTVGAPAVAAFPVDPTGVAATADGPSVAAGGAAITAPGPGAPGEAVTAPAPSTVRAGAASAAAPPPFCAECAAEAPH